MWFPNTSDPEFYNKLYNKREFREDTFKKKGIYQEPYQQFVRKFMNRNTPYDSLLLTWDLGAGKCLAKDTPVLMYSGEIKKVQDIVVGEQVMGDDSSPRTVLDLCTGTSKMYKVEEQDGDTYTVNSNHILSLYNEYKKKLIHKNYDGKEFYIVRWLEQDTIKSKRFSIDSKEEAEKFLDSLELPNFIDMNVEKYLQLPGPVQKQLKGYKKGVEFETRNEKLDIEPYELGHWLMKNKFSFFKSKNVLKFQVLDSRLNKYKLKSEKYIPQEYKCNSREIREKVLLGLLSTNTLPEKTTLKFLESDYRLCQDVIFLIRSLGYKVSHKYSCNSNIFKLCIDFNSATKLTYTLKVSESEEDEYYGFTLDGNKRFILGNFSITHNSLGAISILENFRHMVGADNGYEKFLIITKNSTLQGVFMDELLKDLEENPYVTEIESKNLTSPETIKIIKHRIATKYEFINYDELVNRVLGRTVTSEITGIKKREITGYKIENFDNRIIVIDEVQNVTDNFRYRALMKLLQNSKNIKLIMLSATPIVDSVKEMIYISNLLNFKDPFFKIKESLEDEDTGQLENLYQNNILKKVKNQTLDSKLLSPDKLSKFTDEGKELLLTSLRGKVSYVPSDPTNFPRKNRKGEPLTDKKGSIKVVSCPMSDYQEQAYLFSLTQKTQFHKLSSDTLTMCYESKDIMGSVDKSNLNNTDLTIKKIGKYSSKIDNILKNINKSNGSIFIYSNFVDTSGTILLSQVLDANGFQEFKLNKNKAKIDSRQDYLRYIRYTDELNNIQRIKLQQIFNSPENKDGKIIKVIIGSPMISEGVSFKNVRQIHILEPFWNLARTLQAEGRCIRNYSHIDLKPEERVVDIFWYVSTFNPKNKNKKELTIDQLKYLLCEEKDRINKDVQRNLKEISIDCYNMKQIKKNKQETYKYEDYDAECDYKKCDYSCKYVDSKKLKSLEDTDISTYDQYTDPQEIKAIKNMIKTLFNKSLIWDLPNLEKNLEGTGYNKINLYYALDEMIKKEQLFSVKNKGLGQIVYNDKYYRFKSRNYFNTDNNKTLKAFLSTQKYKTLETKKQEKNIPDKKEKDDISVKEKINKLNQFMSKNNSPVIAIIEDKKFKLVDKRQNKNRLTGRDQSRGRLCSTFNKDEIVEMSSTIGLSLNITQNKKDLCYEMYKYMKNKELILNF